MKTITSKPSYVIDESLNIGQHNWDRPDNLAIGQLSMDKLFKTVAIECPTTIELPRSEQRLNVEQMQFNDPLMQGRMITGEQLLNRRIFNDGLLVMHEGEVVHESYRNGMVDTDRHVIHSCTKSLCAMQVAIAISQGLLDPSAQLTSYLPEFAQHQAWHGVTLQHVLDMQAGIEYNEDYTNPNAHYWSYARAAGYYPPEPGEQAIGAKAWALQNLNKRDQTPGTSFVYNSCLANVLGMVLEKVYQQNLAQIFESLLYQHTGAEASGYFNTDPQGFPITEGQFNLRLRDFARVAFIILNKGKNLAGKQIVPVDFIKQFVVPNKEYQQAYQASNHDSLFKQGQYKNQFWVLDPQQQQFTMLGIHGQFAWFDLPRNLMVVGMGSYPVQDGDLMMKCLNTLWQKIATEVPTPRS
ncbi:serine hydrolase [Thalassotalea psychrophila]|uniref:Serine hydrolase n=1 Tax=Thalassotalea psychrophila TaxID=3065647 RepID=A0ABY9TTC6_9GAMM|nr:serine hydrolase [Colwelliaceae bacterium SQ149]